MPIQQDDKRSEERFNTPSHVDCTFASPVLDDFGKVRIVSISRSGVGLIGAEPIAADMQLVVKLVNHAKKYTKNLLVRVVHVTPQVGGTYLIGGVIDTPLSYEELCAFSI